MGIGDGDEEGKTCPPRPRHARDNMPFTTKNSVLQARIMYVICT